MAVVGFHDVRFPTDISYGSRGGAQFHTEIAVGGDGKEYRNQVWTYDKERWNVAYGVKTEELLVTLLKFHRARRGMAYGFRFKNPDDYQVTDEWLGDGDGIEDEYQLIKAYGDAGGTYYRKITRPILSTVRVYIDSVEETGVTVDDETGLITFDSGAIPVGGERVSWDGEFDIPVRFDADFLPETLSAYKARGAEVPLVGLKE